MVTGQMKMSSSGLEHRELCDPGRRCQQNIFGEKVDSNEKMKHRFKTEEDLITITWQLCAYKLKFKFQ